MRESTIGQPLWDFFISYAAADRSWAEWIAWQLEESDYRVLLQAWDFVPGSHWISTMHAGVQRSSRTIVVLSQAYLSSVFGAAEWQAAWRQDPDGVGGRLLPVRVIECERPGLLGAVVGVDLFGVTEAEAQRKLRSAVDAAITGRAKPARAPKFPDKIGPDSRAVMEVPSFPIALPSIWNVPPRNSNFTGREGDLDILHETLIGQPPPAPCTIYGMGGVGKTQTAIEYIHRHAADYDIVWWVDAEKVVSIGDQFAELGRELGLDQVADVGVMIRSVHRALRIRTRWLLVFDNAVRGQDVGARPSAGSGRVLITTRNRDFRAIGSAVELGVFERTESELLLQRRVPDMSQADAAAIAQRLDDLPLALAQAAAYLDQSRLPATEYLRLLQTRAVDMLSRGGATDHPDSIAMIWSVSVDRLKLVNPVAVQLLRLCCWMAPEPIPLDLFTNNQNVLPDALSLAVRDSIEFIDAVAALVAYSLVRRSGNEIILHRSAQDVAQQDADGMVAQSRELVLAILHADLPAEINDRPQNWPRWRRLLRHVLVATDHSEGWSSAAVVHAAWLLDRAGIYLYVHGRPGDAAQLLSRSVDLRNRLAGAENSEVATSLNNLGLALADLGKPDLAVGCLERALKLLEKVDEPDSFAIAEVLNHLAWAFVLLGRPMDAVEVYERAITERHSSDQPDLARIAADLNGQGRALADLGMPADALRLHERAYSLFNETGYVSDHPWMATTLAYQGRALIDLGRSAEALPLLGRALMIREAAYGTDHPWVATVLNHLGCASSAQARHAEALVLHERALEIHEAVYGAEHPVVAADRKYVIDALAQTRRSREYPPSVAED